VSAPATIGVDNDLASGQTSIALGATDDEEARRLNLWLLVLEVMPLISFADLRGRQCGHQGTWRGWWS
jgi:hypothetical protein